MRSPVDNYLYIDKEIKSNSHQLMINYSELQVIQIKIAVQTHNSSLLFQRHIHAFVDLEMFSIF